MNLFYFINNSLAYTAHIRKLLQFWEKELQDWCTAMSQNIFIAFHSDA